MMWYFLPYSFFILFVVFCLYMASIDKRNDDVIKLRHGKASKIEFEGHSYVVWQQNISDCIIHDPDCSCYIKNEAVK